MRLLFVGDVFGDVGREILAHSLSELTETHKVDSIIVNGENSHSSGRGIDANIVEEFSNLSISCITGGNHSFAIPEVYSVQHKTTLLRPANLKGVNDGEGWGMITLPGGETLLVINLLGKTFMRGKNPSPFHEVDRILSIQDTPPNYTLVDFHAEATSEKVCMAHYLDGRVSAVLGTHTHVQTSDARILSGGTAFITDVGMTGPEHSAIGMELQNVLKRAVDGVGTTFTPSKDGPMFNAVLLDLDSSTGKALSIQTIFRRFYKI